MRCLRCILVINQSRRWNCKGKKKGYMRQNEWRETTAAASREKNVKWWNLLCNSNSSFPSIFTSNHLRLDRALAASAAAVSERGKSMMTYKLFKCRVRQQRKASAKTSFSSVLLSSSPCHYSSLKLHIVSSKKSLLNKTDFASQAFLILSSRSDDDAEYNDVRKCMQFTNSSPHSSGSWARFQF